MSAGFLFKNSILLISLLTIFGCASTNKKEDRTPASISVLAKNKSTQSQKKSMYEELTGKKDKVPFSESELRKKPISTQHYYAGLKAAESKNYIMAIKHYNTIIKKFPRSKEVNLALLAKADLYKEMGLREPANLNLRLAQRPASRAKALSSSKRQVKLTAKSTAKIAAQKELKTPLKATNKKPNSKAKETAKVSAETVSK